MILAHAGAFTFNAESVPACRRALLTVIEWLNDIDGIIGPERTAYEIFEPRLRRFPALELGIPLWLVSILAP